MTHVPAQNTEETNATSSRTATRQRRAPLRGVAMILIAVGILLAIWGVFRITGQSEPTSDTTAATTSAASGAPGDAASQTPGAPGAGNGAGQGAADGTVPGDAAPGEQPAPAQPPAQDPRPVVDPKTVPVTVLNNSTITGLAESQANDLRRDGWRVDEVGNFPDAALPESTVYFTPGNAAEEATARELGNRLHVRVAPRDDVVAHTNPGVVLIITKDVQP